MRVILGRASFHRDSYSSPHSASHSDFTFISPSTITQTQTPTLAGTAPESGARTHRVTHRRGARRSVPCRADCSFLALEVIPGILSDASVPDTLSLTASRTHTRPDVRSIPPWALARPCPAEIHPPPHVSNAQIPADAACLRAPYSVSMHDPARADSHRSEGRFLRLLRVRGPATNIPPSRVSSLTYCHAAECTTFSDTNLILPILP